MSDPLAPLLAAFASLEAPDEQAGGPNRLSALPFPGLDGHRVAKDSQGAPLVLIAVQDEHGRHTPARVEIAHLSVRHGATCRITRPDGTEEHGRFTTVCFRGEDRSLHGYFLRVVGGAVLALGSEPTRAAVVQTVRRLADLFSSLGREPRQSAQGLWAELLLMARSAEPVALVSTWRETPEAPLDFNDDPQRIEVKSVLGPTRRHHFSLEQVRPPDGDEVIVASVLMRRTQDGTSVEELVNEVRELLVDHEELRWQFDANVAATLGRNLRAAFGERFDREYAETSWRFFPALTLPSVHQEVPKEITNVRFLADIAALPSISADQCVSLGGLFAALASASKDKRKRKSV